MGKTVPTGVTLLLLGVILMAALPAQAASVSMREGLYLEEVEGDLEGAILIYQGIIDDQTAAENIVAQALYHQGLCYMKQGRETEAKAAFTQVIDNHSSQTDLIARIKPLLDELGNADPAALMPPETIAYVELGSPGQQIETILNMLKGTPLENPLEMIRNAAGNSAPGGVGTQVTALAALLNPNMTAEFKKVRGMGFGITGVTQNGPSFVAVLFPGKSDALRGLLQMVLGMVGQPADDIETMHCLTISEQVSVAYDDNVIILTQAEPDRRQLRWCIQQYLGTTHEPTLASSNSAFATVDKRSRQQNALTVWLNVGQTYNRLGELIPGGEIPPQVQMVNGFVDFANVRDLIASLSLQAAGLTVGADVNLNEGHNCMAYNIAHTPTLDKTVLRAVPADAIAVASIGLGPSDTMQAQMLSQQLAGALGMDIGAALFDNIDQITVFALPFIPSSQRDGAELNSLGLIITSENPQETYDLIGGALRTAEAVREESEPVAGRYQFTFPNNVTIYGYMDQNLKTTILSPDEQIVEKSMAAARGAGDPSTSGPLTAAIKALPETTNKLVLVNIGGFIDFGAAASNGDDEETLEQVRTLLRQMAQASRQSMLQLSTSEEDDGFAIRLAVSDLPPAAEVIGPITQFVQLIENVNSQPDSWATPVAAPPAAIFPTKTPPVIDGKPDDVWLNPTVTAYPLENSYFDAPDSEQDCSASFRLLSDPDRLYILVDVTDEALVHDSEDHYLDDSVEVFIRADDSSSTYEQRNRHYFFTWDATSPETGLRQTEVVDGVTNEIDRPSDSGAADFAMVKTPTGYRAEISLPWAAFGIQPDVGTSIGLDIHVNDDDDGGERDSKLGWFGLEDTAWSDPHYLGTATIAGMVGWWKLDESTGTTAADSSDGGHNGTLVGDPEWLPTGGKIGGALQLDGQGDCVETDMTTDLGTWTVAVWVKSPAAPTSGDPTGPVHREKNYQISWNHPVEQYMGSAAVSVGGMWYPAKFGPLEADTWYHLVGTYDGENLKAYTNGVLVTDNADPSGAPDSEAMPLMLGRHAVDETYFAGTIDDVRIYNYALGQADVAALDAGQ